MKKEVFNCWWPHIKAIIVFILISFLYFSPEVFEGKTVVGGDSRIGTGQEVLEYRQKTGETSRWTNSLFSGMPNYQISPSYDSTSFLTKVKAVYSLYLPAPVFYVFIMLLGFYILLLALGIRPELAVLGAIGYAFSSYFFILIEAGHIWKLLTLAFIPPTIAGVVLAYQGKYLGGGILLTLFLSLQILSNHIQMTYYSLFIVAAYVISVGIDRWKERQFPAFIKASIVCCIAALIAIAINSSNLFHTWQYSKESIRGKSELTHDQDNKTSTGLDRDYMVQWSYGIGETWTLLIPNTKGGSSGYLGQNKAIREVPQQYQQIVAGQNQYWGDDPFTEGPVYAGAFLMTLFIMSLFLLRTRLKWALFSVFLLTVFLSWGQNMMWLTNLFADYFPMYSKFRSVSSILVVAEFIIPLLAVLMLKEIVTHPDILRKKKKQVYISFGLTGGMALLFALFPGTFFNFLSAAEAHNYLGQAALNPELNAVIEAIEQVRMSIFRSDAWRSFIYIGLGGILLWRFARNYLKSRLFIGLLTLLCLVDIWTVDKRYLNADSYISRQQASNLKSFSPKTAADIEILQDKDPNYRVLNTTVNTFNDATTSLYHKSIGGYHAAKLRRYQDIIEHHLIKGNMNVLNMLNTRYLIVPGPDQKPRAQYNPGALGNAWFVDSIKWVDNADQEIDALTDFNPSRLAIVDKRFSSLLQNSPIGKDSTSRITLVSYKPNELIYKSQSPVEGLGVFSEVYYPYGWKATVDGKEVPLIRVNYILRSLLIPAGEHEIKMTFKPRSLHATETIAYCGLGLFMLALALWIFKGIRNKKRTAQ